MFIVNAVAFFFQVCSVCLWYFEFYQYTTSYYILNCNKTPILDDGTNCDDEKVSIRKVAISWWFGSNIANFFAQLALVLILCSFGQK